MIFSLILNIISKNPHFGFTINLKSFSVLTVVCFVYTDLELDIKLHRNMFYDFAYSVVILN